MMDIESSYIYHSVGPVLAFRHHTDYLRTISFKYFRLITLNGMKASEEISEEQSRQVSNIIQFLLSHMFSRPPVWYVDTHAFASLLISYTFNITCFLFPRILPGLDLRASASQGRVRRHTCLSGPTATVYFLSSLLRLQYGPNALNSDTILTQLLFDVDYAYQEFFRSLSSGAKDSGS